MFITSKFIRLPSLAFLSAVLSFGLIALGSKSVRADVEPLIFPQEDPPPSHSEDNSDDQDPLTVGQSEEENNSEESKNSAEGENSAEGDRTPLEMLLKLINAEREKVNSPPLQLSPQLGEAAQNHAEDMAANDFVTPVNPRGIGTEERVSATGYTTTNVTENLGLNHSQPQAILEKWLDSPGYRLSLLNPEYTEAGLGYANNPTSRFKHYWSLVLALPESTAVVAPLRTFVLQVEGELSEEDLTLEDESRYDEYSFEGKAGQTVFITLESDEFDTFLALFNGQNQQIAESDDISEENSNSQLTLVLPRDDTYTVIVNSYSAGSRGSYKVSVESEEKEPQL